MKKILLTFFVIFSSVLTNASFVNAWFLDGDDDLNMYKKIDEGVYKLHASLLSNQLKWGKPDWDIWKQLNSYLIDKCFKEDWSIKESDITNIQAQTWAYLTSIYSILKDECKNNWALTYAQLSIYSDTIKNHYKKSDSTASANTKEIYQISRIGLYSDWVDENSPFDLMSDIKDINKVIFTEDIPYEWVNSMNNDSALAAYLNWKLGQDIINAAQNPSILANNWDANNTSNNSSSNNISWDNNDSSYACKTNESGLSQKQLDSLMPTWWSGTNLAKIDNVWVNSKQDPNSGWSFSGNKNVSGNAYSPLNDNSLWPCNEFFCITINFKMYSQNLLWGGKTNSIQALIERSNWHLKKFTNSSLIRSRQTTNNFQIGLKDLSLPDLFNVNFVISKKAPPILNLHWWKELANTPNKDNITKTLIQEYFKNYWIEYNRVNDLDIFEQQECEIASVINSAEQQINKSPLKFNDCKNNQYKQKLNEVISQNIDSSLMADDLKGFNNQFVELAWFLANFPDYANNIKITITNMSKKWTWSK